jgi:uncharacterized protein (DUF736 family)
MKIATSQKLPATGNHLFEIKLPFCPVTTVVMEKAEATSDRAPAFNLFYEGEKCGALWKRSSQSGESFLSGPIEAPVFPGGRLEVAIFHSKSEPGALEMTWRAPAQSRTGAAAPAPSAPSALVGDDGHTPF